MKRITIISENNAWYTNTYQKDEEAVHFLKKYIEENNIESNENITDEHKLLLDISRDNNLVVKSIDNNKTIYIPENINNDQYIAYINMSHGIITSVYDWFDSSKEYNGYHIIEGNDQNKNEKLALKIRKNMYEKLVKSEKKSKRRSTL